MSRPAGFTATSLFCSLAMLLGGCGQSTSEKLEQSSKSLTSWRRSLYEGASLYARGAVPALYLKQLQIAAAQQLDEQGRDLVQAANSPGADQLQQQLQQLHQWQYELSIAAARHDRASARWIADALKTDEQNAQSDDAGGRVP